MSSSEGSFGGVPLDYLLGQAAAAAASFASDNMNMQQQQQQDAENGPTKKKRNKNRSSLQLPSGSKTVDKSSGFLPKNGRKANGQHHNHNNNNNNQPRHSLHQDFQVLGDKDDVDSCGPAEFNGNFNQVHSARGPATASWTAKQDNTKAVPDPSVIVERLIHLRDCIKQVTSIMHSLEKADQPNTGKQINNLNQMLQVLRTEEQENMELLQQVLACRDESSASNAVQRDQSPIQASSSSDRRRNNPVQQDTNETDEEPQNDLLLRMLDSQKKFASIQEQQASLLRLQKQAEEKLAAARAFHDHIVQTSLAAGATSGGVAGSVSSNLSTSSVSSDGSGSGRPNALSLREQEICEDDASSGALVIHDHSDEADDDLLVGNRPPVVPPRKDESRGTPTFDLEDIQKRITALRELQADRQVQYEQLEETGLATSGPSRLLATDIVSREQAHRSTERQRQQLESKLRQLQEKKQQMNSLLAELSTLHCPHSPSDDQLELGSSVSPASFASPVNSSSSHKAKVVSDIGETLRKRRQLEEMKNTLKTLQRLTENIEQVDSSLNKEDLTSPPPPPPTRGRSQGPLEVLPSLKPDNLRRDCAATSSTQFPARRHYEAEGRANEDADMQNVVASAGPPNTSGLLSVAPSSNVSNASSISRSTSAASVSRSIDQKFQKLADAQSKLHQLKQLLNMMQQQNYQDGGEEQMDSASLSALLAGLEQTDLVSPVNGHSPVEMQHHDPGEESEDSGVSADQGKVSQADLQAILESAKGQQQLKQELEDLLLERRKVDSLLQQQQAAPPCRPPPSSSGDSLNNSRDRSSAEGGAHFRSRAGSQLASSFMSNEMGRQDNLHRENCSEAKTLNSQANNNNGGGRQGSKSRSHSRSAASPTGGNRHQVNQNNNNNNNNCQNGLTELSDQLNYNLALRDELRAQKAVLQELLKQERSKQMGFSHNQDSQSGSETRGKTEKSEVGSIQCASTASPLDSQETTAVAHWALMGHATDDTPSFSASDNLQGYDDRHHSGLSSPWQKNFSSSSPAQEDLSVFQPVTHLPFVQNYPTASRLPPPLSGGRLPAPIWGPQQCQSQWDQLSRHFQKQAESTHALCQAVLREQQAAILMAAAPPDPNSAGTSSTASSNGMASNGGAPTELLSSYVQQLQQQQQLLFSLSHCFHLLCLQQLQVTQIHAAWAIQQGSSGSSHGAVSQSPFSYQAISEPLTSYSSQWPTSASTGKLPSVPQPSSSSFPLPPPPPAPLGASSGPSPFAYQPMSGSAAYNLMSADDNTSVSSGHSLPGRGATETLNNQVPPGSRTNNFLDNFRSNSRQNLLSSKCNEPQRSRLGSGGMSQMPVASAAHLRSSFSFSGLAADEPALPHSPSQSSITRQNMSGDGGSHFGGVRPRTKKPNFSQDKSLSTQSLPGLSGVPHQQTQGHHAPLNRSRSLFSPISTRYSFGDNQPKPAVQPKEQQKDPSVQESIYSEVSQLLSQWEEQPSILRDLLEQIRAFQVAQPPSHLPPPPPPPPTTAAATAGPHRSNLLPFSTPPSDRCEDGSPLSTCQSKLSKQNASFGSKSFKSHNSSSSCQQRPLVSTVPPSAANLGLPSSQRHPQLYSTDPLKNQESLQRQGMESIPESYTAAVKSEKPDIVSQLRGGLSVGEVPVSGLSEESCSLGSSVSSPASSSSSHNNNNKATPFNCSSHPQQSEDYRAAPDGGAALPPSPSLQLGAHSLPLVLSQQQQQPSMAGAGTTKFPEDWYDAEGETEAETEDDDTKDLAEADQSAGQINLAHDLRDMVLDCSGSSSLSLGGAGGGTCAEGAEGGEDLCTLSTDIVSSSTGTSTNPCCSCPLIPAAATNGTLDSNSCQHSCLSSSAQGSAPDLDVDELALDDVPIKLETLSPEELHRQMLEEQACNSLLGEMLTDAHGVHLAPDTEINHAGAF